MVPVRGAAVLSALQALTGDNSLKSGVVRGLEYGRGDTGWKPKNRIACLTMFNISVFVNFDGSKLLP
jgi:hypothetical protein